MKNRGITMAVLYIPYQTIQNPTTFANSEDFYANANIPNIPPALKTCASAGFFYTANTPADITPRSTRCSITRWSPRISPTEDGFVGWVSVA